MIPNHFYCGGDPHFFGANSVEQDEAMAALRRFAIAGTLLAVCQLCGSVDHSGAAAKQQPQPDGGSGVCGNPAVPWPMGRMGKVYLSYNKTTRHKLHLYHFVS